MIKASIEGVEDDSAEDECPVIESPKSVLNYMALDRTLIFEDSPNELKNLLKEEFDKGFGEGQLIDDKVEEVPFIPNTKYEHYQNMINHWIGWFNFRNFYV